MIHVALKYFHKILFIEKANIFEMIFVVGFVCVLLSFKHMFIIFVSSRFLSVLKAISCSSHKLNGKGKA